MSLVNLLYAFSKLSFVDEDCFACLIHHVTPFVKERGRFTPQNICNVAWSLATSDIDAPELFAALATTSIPMASEFTEQGLSMTAWSFSKVSK